MYGSHRQGVLPMAPRARAVFLILVVAFAGVLVGLLRAQSDAQAGNGKITICHATSSATNPYVEISVSNNGANGGKLNDHTSHEDDIIPAPAGGCPATIPPGPGDPGGHEHKVDVCHVTGSATNPVVMINIAQSALQHHLDHGDYLADAQNGCTIVNTPPPGPGPNNGGDPKAPASAVVTSAPVVQGSAPSSAAARACTSRRSFRIRIRSKRRDPVTKATVSVNGKLVRTLRGKRLTAPVVLRGLPKGRFAVKITATTRSGRKITGTRRYRTCTPKATRQTIPLL
jgi:hypothetical protein